MKKLFLLVLLVLSCLTIYAKTQSIALVTGTDKGVNLRLPASLGSENVFSGTMKGNVNGAAAYFYCIDLNHRLEYNSQYQDVQSTNSKITYILNNYYPYKPLPYTGSLTVDKEASAIQLAIWSISDNLDISACTPETDASTIKNRALAIAADAAAHAGSIQPFKTLVINLPAQSFTKGSPVSFTVEAYNEVGAPIPGVAVSLSVNEGNLSKTQVTTGSNGVSEVITLTAGPHFSSIITANGRVIIPGGTQYFNVADPNGKQKLVIAAPVNAQKTVTGTVNWYEPVQLSLAKTCASIKVADGDKIDYKITVSNTGNVPATGVTVSDLLPAVLQFESADGAYNPATGIWNVGTLAVSESKTITISVRANFNQGNTNIFDLGAAADFNLFVLNDLNQPSSDTQGKVAVGHDATLQGYSVGDVLPANSGYVLVVGRKLTFKSGRVYGDIAFGSFIDTTHWDLADGIIRQTSPIDFGAASVYLNNLSNQMSALSSNGTVTFEYGQLALKGTNPNQNRFLINGSDLSKCNDLLIDVPANSVVLINVAGNNIDWKGGMELKGASNSKVLFNFYEAVNLKISGIEVKGSILAPKATLNFPAGLISGQVIAYNVNGSGQFNHVKFNGKITLEMTITNIAEVQMVDQPAPSGKPLSMAKVNSAVNLTSVTKEKNSVPVEMDLLQNYPNPFNPSTIIRFDIAEQGRYSVKVYNTLGREVAVIANENFAPGSYHVTFNAGELPSGLYIYQLTGNNVNISRKMMLIK